MLRGSGRALKPVVTNVGPGTITSRAREKLREGGVVLSEALDVIKGTVMEAMARKMPEKDRNFLAERWGFSVSSDQRRLSSASSIAVAAEAIAADKKIIIARGVADRCGREGQVEEQLTTTDAEVALAEKRETKLKPKDEMAETIHPILGQLVADLKYKRVYRTSIEALIKAPVWEKQRILRPERARAIAEAKIKESSGSERSGIPGVITLFSRPRSALSAAKGPDGDILARSTAEDGERELGIVDGQHRVGALMLMAERGSWSRTERNIVVDVFPTKNEREISSLFTEINSGEPVKLVDMPGEGAAEDVKAILNEATAALEEKYPAMFKTSMRCRPPHVNADNLRDEIFQSDMISRHGLKTSTQVLNWLLKLNASLGRRGIEKWKEVSNGKNQETFAKVLAKAHDNKFYLGLDKSWLHV